VLVPRVENIDDMFSNAVNVAKTRGIVKAGDIVTITAGVLTGTKGSTNLLQVYQVE